MVYLARSISCQWLPGDCDGCHVAYCLGCGPCLEVGYAPNQNNRLRSDGQDWWKKYVQNWWKKGRNVAICKEKNESDIASSAYNNDATLKHMH